MKVKSITISRSNLCSKFPGVVPSLADSWFLNNIGFNCNEEGELNVFYDYSDAVSKASEYGMSPSTLEYDCYFEYLDNNYGLIVSDVIIPKSYNGENISVTDYTDLYVNVPKENYYKIIPNIKNPSFDTNRVVFSKQAIKSKDFFDLNDKDSYVHYEGRSIISGDTEIKILTYYSLVKWYNFFKNYFKTIGKYESAIEYYQHEYEVKNATDEKKYSDMDELFKARGGKPMYNWMKDVCFMTFKIPEEFSDEWKTNELTFTDALKWQKWFKDRYELYNNKDCSKTDNCCECDEYKRLGGEKFLTTLTKWIGESEENFDGFDSALHSASYNIPILLTRNIDDMGIMSVLSENWQEGVDYHNTLTSGVYLDEENGGTVVNRPYYKDNYGNVVYDFETYIIKNDTTKGYKQNEFYENEFFYDDWQNYTDFYINNHIDEFSTNGVNTYAFSTVNGKIIYNPSFDSEKNVFYENEIIDYVKKESVLINETLFDVIDGQYVIPNYINNGVANISLKSNKMLPVINDGGLKYVELNGKKYYVKKDKNGINKVFFLEDSNCYDEGTEVLNGKYIIYNNKLYLLNKGKIVLEDNINYCYDKVDGYFEYDGITFYIVGRKVTLPSVTTDINGNIYFGFEKINEKTLEKLNCLNIELINEKIVISHIIDATYSNKITGYTESKLNLLRRRKINTDELGNELPGYFDLNTLTYNNLYTLSEEPCFCDDNEKSVQFSYDSNLSLYGSHYNTPYNECTLDLLYKVGEVSELKRFYDENETPYFVGNYLESIEFYYADENGKHINSVFVNGEDSRPYLKLFDKDGKKYKENMKLYCDMTYYMDATLIDTGEKYVLDKNNKNYIKCVDTLYVTKEVGNFYMGDKTFFTFTYYLLNGEFEKKYISDFNDEKRIYLTKFEIIPKLYVPKYSLSLKILSNNYNGSCLNESLLEIDLKEKNGVKEVSPWEKNNNMSVFPIFREECYFGFSTPQNINDNIYIDRGVNASFEKHLKLMEAHTLEALENYGNGYFKINKS